MWRKEAYNEWVERFWYCRVYMNDHVHLTPLIHSQFLLLQITLHSLLFYRNNICSFLAIMFIVITWTSEPYYIDVGLYICFIFRPTLNFDEKYSPVDWLYINKIALGKLWELCSLVCPAYVLSLWKSNFVSYEQIKWWWWWWKHNSVYSNT